MFEKTFCVHPAGIYGMDKLAAFLNLLKTQNVIGDWHPHRSVTGTGGVEYVVAFDTDAEGLFASREWTSAHK